MTMAAVERSVKGLTVAVMVLAGMTALAFPEIPKASAKALGVTRGKPFTAGLVFINGRFITPPYTVERWGTGLRINGRQITGQIIDWSEFAKTQTGFKATRNEEAPAVEPAALAPVPAPAAEPVVTVADDDSSLDDLFDDDPKPKAKKPVKPVVAPKPKAPPKPKVTVEYSFDGNFIPNETTRNLVLRINAARTEIDRLLRAGGFLCFGDSYSRVTGDDRTAKKLIEALPEIMKNATSEESFMAGVRGAQLYYLNDTLCKELFRNRIDYRRLQEFRERQRRDEEWKNVLKRSSQPLL